VEGDESACISGDRIRHAFKNEMRKKGKKGEMEIERKRRKSKIVLYSVPSLSICSSSN
jgi:hypothetical protein